MYHVTRIGVDSLGYPQGGFVCLLALPLFPRRQQFSLARVQRMRLEKWWQHLQDAVYCTGQGGGHLDSITGRSPFVYSKI
jgi:hypothetical protein